MRDSVLVHIDHVIYLQKISEYGIWNENSHEGLAEIKRYMVLGTTASEGARSYVTESLKFYNATIKN
jgi:hypothetical protein